jgi:Na+-driven multidrug efflux pump
MLRFMTPAVVIPLADPLMSLVDTVCIGQFVGTVELAALGPANLVLAFMTYAFQSVQVATIRWGGAWRAGALAQGAARLPSRRRP